MRKHYFITPLLSCTLLLSSYATAEKIDNIDPNVAKEIQAFLAEQPVQKIPPLPHQTTKIIAANQKHLDEQEKSDANSEEMTKEINQEITSALQTTQQPITKIGEVPVEETQSSSQGDGIDVDGPPAHPSMSVEDIEDAVVKNEERSRYGNPPSYYALGKRYQILGSGKGYHDRGIASWYGTKFHNKPTSSHEPYDMFKMTAAHKTLPIPCYVRVTNLQNGKQVIVRVNDRGPFHENRIIDLSYAAAKKLNILGHGTGLVDVELVESSGAPHAVAIDHQPQIYLQIGAFSQSFNAKAHAKRLAKRFHQPVEVTEASLNHRSVWRVQLGPIQSVAQSDYLSHAVKLAGFGSALAVVR